VRKKKFVMKFVVGMPKKKCHLNELYRYQVKVFVITVMNV